MQAPIAGELIRWLDFMGTVVFALSGVLQARRLRMDGFGVLVLATVTAIGGGTMRDLVLGVRPVFWVTQSEYLWLIAITCLLGIPGGRLLSARSVQWLLLRADALGLAVFTAIGTNKALMVGAPPVVAVAMGVLTGVGGGMIRDILAREVPMVLRTEIYATACIVGAITMLSLAAVGVSQNVATLCGVLMVLLIRLAALEWGWHLPVFGEGKRMSHDDQHTDKKPD